MGDSLKEKILADVYLIRYHAEEATKNLFAEYLNIVKSYGSDLEIDNAREKYFIMRNIFMDINDFIKDFDSSSATEDF